MKRKILSIIIIFGLVLALLPATALAVYTDSQDHWAEAAIDKWSANGIIQGYDGKFRPEDPITRGELAIIIDRLMKYRTAAENAFTDLDQNYYTEAILKANAAGVITGYDGKVRPTDNITREEAVVMLCRAFGLDESSAASGFTDSASISQWARGSVNAMAARGFVHGYQGTFRPLDSISRAEIVTVLDNAVSGFYTEEKEYTGDVSGIAIINAPGVVLKDMTINGDLVVAEGVGTGDVTLQNVVVTGNTIVRGGGANSIHIVGGSQISNLIIEKTDSGQIRIVTEDGSAVEAVYVDDGNDDIILTGTFESVSITAAVSVKVVDAVIGTVKVTGENTRIDIDAASTVTTLSADAPITVDNKGTITKAEVSVENVTITGNKPKDITYATGVAGDSDKDDGGNTGGGGFLDTTAPTLKNITFTANGTVLTGTVDGGYTLEADRNSETNYLIDFSGTTSSEALSGGPFALTLDETQLSETQRTAMEAYYNTKPEPYKSYLLAALDGSKPFAYIQAGSGNSVSLLDGAQYTLDSKSISMVIPGDYPLGTYVLKGQIVDAAGNKTDLIFKLIVTVPAGTVWTDLADTAWYADSETSFTLTTAEQLAGLAELVNGGNNFTGKTVVLGYDIDLFGIEWIPIGIDTNDGLKAFAGTFNGNNKTVSNLVINTAYVGNAGLFGCVKSGAVIKDLALSNVTINTTNGTPADTEAGKAVGALVGGLSYSNVPNTKVLIRNITVTGANIKGAGRVGGIVGWVKDSISGVEIYNVNVTGNISAVFNTDNGDKAGGIIGQTQSATIIKDATANVVIAGFRDLGGIAGYSNVGTYKDCSTSGSVTASPIEGVSKDPYAGGILGRLGSNVTITNCNSAATVTSFDSSCAGKIFGGPAEYVTIANVVNQSTGTAYTTIQTALNAATAGDTLYVGPGVYKEDVNISKAITLEGGGADRTIIVGATIGNPTNVSTLAFNTSGATVRGLTLTHEYTPDELEAWNFNNNGVTFGQGKSGNTLENCIITLNRNGIYLNNTTGNNILNNKIHNNRTGINMCNIINGTEIKRNQILDNWTLGIVFYDGGTEATAAVLTTVTIDENTFEGNWYSDILIKDANSTSGFSSTGTLNVGNKNSFLDYSSVTFTTSKNTVLDEPAFTLQKPAFLGGTGEYANAPSFVIPALRNSSSEPAALGYVGVKTMIVDNTYFTIADALAAAAEDDTIIVKEDISLGATLVIDKAGITINGQDHAINQAIHIAADNVTIKNLTGTANGIFVGGPTAFYITNKNVTLEKITVDGKDQDNSIAIRGYDGAEFTVKNSSFSNFVTGIFAHHGNTIPGAGQNILNAMNNTFTNVLAGIGGTEKTTLNAIGNTFVSVKQGGEGIGLGTGVIVVGAETKENAKQVALLESTNTFDYPADKIVAYHVRDYR